LPTLRGQMITPRWKSSAWISRDAAMLGVSEGIDSGDHVEAELVPRPGQPAHGS